MATISDTDHRALVDAQTNLADRALENAKQLLRHYFGISIPKLSSDSNGEIETIVDDIVEAAVARVAAKMLEDERAAPATRSPSEVYAAYCGGYTAALLKKKAPLYDIQDLALAALIGALHWSQGRVMDDPQTLATTIAARLAPPGER